MVFRKHDKLSHATRNKAWLKTAGPEYPSHEPSTVDPLGTISIDLAGPSIDEPSEAFGQTSTVGVLKEYQCLRDPAPIHPDHANVQRRLRLRSPRLLKDHQMNEMHPKIPMPERVRVETPPEVSVFAEAENVFEEAFHRPHPFECLELREPKIPGKSVAYNNIFRLKRRMERAADEYLTVVNDTARECDNNIKVLDYQQLLNCGLDFSMG